MVTKTFPKSEDKVFKEVDKMMALLRRVYDLIEESHLNEHKLLPVYCEDIRFPRQLGEDIFNYLSGKDEEFRKIFIKRQKRYRKRNKL